jgi:hypothetical protein
MKKFIFFISQLAIQLFLGSKQQQTHPALKRENPPLQHNTVRTVHFCTFFLFMWVIFSQQDPDPDHNTEIVYSTAGLDVDPDPQHCLQ